MGLRNKSPKAYYGARSLDAIYEKKIGKDPAITINVGAKVRRYQDVIDEMHACGIKRHQSFPNSPASSSCIELLDVCRDLAITIDKQGSAIATPTDSSPARSFRLGTLISSSSALPFQQSSVLFHQASNLLVST